MRNFIVFLFIVCLLSISPAKGQTATQAFTQIYENGVWGKDAQGNGTSGGGSSVKNAKNYMIFLQDFLKKNHIKSVVDVGCGDWRFSQYLDWSDIIYIGYDVVKSVIDENNKKFSNKNCQFIFGDATQIDLPRADLLICKDVLQHLSNENIFQFLKQLGRFKHCLITNDVDFKIETSDNKDIDTGGYRILDITKEPFFVNGNKVLTYVSNKNKKQVLHICSNKAEHAAVDLFTEKVIYKFDKDPIDVVIVCVAKDARTLDMCIDGIKRNASGIRRVIVISPEKLTSKAEWFDEAKFPFSKKDLLRQIFKDENYKLGRIGWIYQQLLKLYSSFVIPNISSNILLLDADTIFLNKVSFYDEDSGAGFFNPGKEYHVPYFNHGKKLIPGFRRLYPDYSGISHHMLVQRPILEDMFLTVEKIFKTSFWRAFCDCIDLNDVKRSCVSEYELYFNFTLLRTDQCKIRKLKWANAKLQDLEPFKNDGYHYISCHTYLDKK